LGFPGIEGVAGGQPEASVAAQPDRCLVAAGGFL
jgi:hypothetical protein